LTTGLYSVDPPTLHFEPPGLRFEPPGVLCDSSVHGPLWLLFEPLMLLIFDLHANPYPDPAFHSNADPEQIHADPYQNWFG
jgi:hypothetical protein